jgi:hypothetical protein
MGIALFNRLKSTLNSIPLNDCRFTSIGGITGASTQIIRTYQENNRVPKKWFVYNTSIQKLNDIKILILFLIIMQES